MAQMTWRTTEELLERVRRQAEAHGRSLNEWVSTVLAAASDPSYAGDQAQQLRERLTRAGILDESAGTRARRPDAKRVAQARHAAGQGTALSDIISASRR
jgi:hypothetical protein